MKKILASVAAVALAVSAMSIAAFAEAEEPATTFEGSTTIIGENWWAEKEISIEDLIGDLNPDDVKSITFTCADHDFQVGYNSVEGWGQPDMAREIVVTDVLLKTVSAPTDDDPDAVREYSLKVCISDDSGDEFTISWVASTEEPAVTDPEETDPEETDPEETDPEETDPEETDPEETDPEETTDAAGDVNGDKGEGDKNQPTGVVLAVIPAAVAGAAVVIAKKRK